jgi:predicted transcriptional regulator
MYIDILKVLGQRGPTKLTHITYRANANRIVLKDYLDFLIEQGLIEERMVGKSNSVYAITVRGTKVLRSLRELNKALSLEECDEILQVSIEKADSFRNETAN